METNNKQQRILYIIIIVLSIVITFLVGRCSKSCEEGTVPPPEETAQSYNISILLDLSDRLLDNSQIKKDTQLINYIADFFIEQHKSLTQKDLYKNGDKMKVFFYPQPQILDINKYQEDLSVEMIVKGKGKAQIKEIVANRDTLANMKNTWHNALDKIYTNTIKTKDCTGSDIWGFFDKSAKTYCIKKGSRNILVILTDGYLYHKDSWGCIKNKIYSGIVPRTVDIQDSIAPIDIDLSGLEVLFLEINPKKSTDFSKIKKLLVDWCKAMRIEHVEVAQTDLPANTKQVIENFLKND